MNEHDHDPHDPTQDAHAGHGPDWGVMRCGCGMLHVKIGPLRMEFTPQQFRRLQDLMNKAAWQYGLDGEAAPTRSLGHVDDGGGLCH